MPLGHKAFAFKRGAIPCYIYVCIPIPIPIAYTYAYIYIYIYMHISYIYRKYLQISRSFWVQIPWTMAAGAATTTRTGGRSGRSGGISNCSTSWIGSKRRCQTNPHGTMCKCLETLVCPSHMFCYPADCFRHHEVNLGGSQIANFQRECKGCAR